MPRLHQAEKGGALEDEDHEEQVVEAAADAVGLSDLFAGLEYLARRDLKHVSREEIQINLGSPREANR